MYARVILCSGYSVPLWYRIPNFISVAPGVLVKVPLRTQKVTGIVIYITSDTPACAEMKEIIARETIPNDPLYLSYLAHLAQMYQLPSHNFIKRIQQFLHDKKKIDAPYQPQMHTTLQLPLLTTQQQAVCTFLIPFITTSVHLVALLHGVTGSGKTEVYKQIIHATVTQKKTVLFLLPEVSLAVEFEQRLIKELPQIPHIIGFHSGKSVKEKTYVWEHLLKQTPLVIVGVHLPVLLPIANLGCIIIDEEHDQGFQEKKHPKINSKQAALLRAKLYNIPILLGSATPSVEALYHVKQGKWKFFQLTERFGGTLPTITVAQLKNAPTKRACFWITKELKEAIEQTLKKKEQVILFLNRRGFSFFVQCTVCTHVFRCIKCSVSLTLHEQDRLRCHYCDYHLMLPSTCSSCAASSDHFLKKGVGTQQLMRIVQDLFPHARIARADMDSTQKKTEWQQTVAQFKGGMIDILIGTQTITKGYHFPNVTLVGIIWADSNIHFPVFNATEHAIQQLIQVSGRAGRTSATSHVIIQMMDTHVRPLVVSEMDYLSFFKSEIAQRSAAFYPPIATLVEIEVRHKNEQLIERETDEFVTLLRTHAANTAQIVILGPAKPIIHKIKNVEIRTIFIKGSSLAMIVTLYKKIAKKRFASSFFFTPLW